MIISKIKKAINKPVVTPTLALDADTLISRVTEDDIREEAYKIWETEGCQGDSLNHWLRAKENIEKRIRSSAVDCRGD